MTIDLNSARELFDASTDFTVGLEEEFSILDPTTLDLVQRFEELRDVAAADPVLADSIAGELISSEIEIRSGRGESFGEAVAMQRDRRRRLFALAAEQGVALGATGTHPWADYREQHIIDTEHYRRLDQELGSRCGVPDAFGGWQAFADYVDFLIRTNSIIEYTQVWWSIRPHPTFGTVEVRICDAQSTAAESEGLSALMVACIAQAARDVDEGRPFDDPAPRLIEENLWRATRYGLDGRLIDLERAEEYPAPEALARLLAWTAPARAELGLEPALGELNGAQRQRRMIDAGAGMEEVFAAAVRETRETYVQEVAA